MYVKKTTQQSGFTLIELMITIAILGVLAGLALPSFQRSIAKTKMQDNTSRIDVLLKKNRSDSVLKQARALKVSADNKTWNTAGKTQLLVDGSITVVLTGTIPADGIKFNRQGQSNVALKFDICVVGSGIKAFQIKLHRNGSSETFKEKGSVC